MRICFPVIAFFNSYSDTPRPGPVIVIVEIIPAGVAMVVPSPVIAVICREPVIMVSVVIVPVERTPWMPIGRVISPVP